MNKKQKEEQYKLFTKAFHEVLAPELTDIKGNITEFKEEVKDVNRRIGKLETRVTALKNHL